MKPNIKSCCNICQLIAVYKHNITHAVTVNYSFSQVIIHDLYDIHYHGKEIRSYEKPISKYSSYYSNICLTIVFLKGSVLTSIVVRGRFPPAQPPPASDKNLSYKSYVYISV